MGGKEESGGQQRGERPLFLPSLAHRIGFESKFSGEGFVRVSEFRVQGPTRLVGWS